MSPPDPLALAVLASGTGSNLRSLAAAIDDGRCAARITSVVSDRSKAAALGFARDRGWPTTVVRAKDHPDRATWDAALADAVAEADPDLVVLAGFMKIVGPAFLERFGGRTINVHPSILPAFPGLDAPGQAAAGGARFSGCTVHLVDAGVDTGPILAQAMLPVRPTDDGPTLHARIQRLEHQLLPAVVDALSRGDRALPPRARLDALVDATDDPPPLRSNPPL